MLANPSEMGAQAGLAQTPSERRGGPEVLRIGFGIEASEREREGALRARRTLAALAPCVWSSWDTPEWIPERL